MSPTVESIRLTYYRYSSFLTQTSLPDLTLDVPPYFRHTLALLDTQPSLSDSTLKGPPSFSRSLTLLVPQSSLFDLISMVTHHFLYSSYFPSLITKDQKVRLLRDDQTLITSLVRSNAPFRAEAFWWVMGPSRFHWEVFLEFLSTEVTPDLRFDSIIYLSLPRLITHKSLFLSLLASLCLGSVDGHRNVNSALTGRGPISR